MKSFDVYVYFKTTNKLVFKPDTTQIDSLSQEVVHTHRVVYQYSYLYYGISGYMQTCLA